jgi:hypothetical protein
VEPQPRHIGVGVHSQSLGGQVVGLSEFKFALVLIRKSTVGIGHRVTPAKPDRRAQVGNRSIILTCGEPHHSSVVVSSRVAWICFYGLREVAVRLAKVACVVIPYSFLDVLV